MWLKKLNRPFCICLLLLCALCCLVLFSYSDTKLSRNREPIYTFEAVSLRAIAEKIKKLPIEELVEYVRPTTKTIKKNLTSENFIETLRPSDKIIETPAIEASIKQKNYPVYHEDNLRTEWHFKIEKKYERNSLREWHEPAPVNYESGVGENGTAYKPSPEIEPLMKEIYQKHNFNLYASDLMPLRRSLKDPRSDECKKLSYPEKLPTTSVIIIFHNEAWTPLLRTIWSIIDRSPPELIEEIILIDDVSTWDFLKRPLEDYIKLLPVKVKLIRTTKREGLIRARLIGAKHATGKVMTFFDGHMECTEGWLQPILARIASDRSVVAVPLVDRVSSDDMSYMYNEKILINGFRWSLIFHWMDVPERELNRTKRDVTAPIRTPTLIGCAFSIDRDFFFEIGSYDEGMNIWGSENLEMALRVWQCGGAMELIPCSHVGHLYRVSTYSFNGDASLIRNTNNVRLVEVWMDDLKHLFYAANPRTKKVNSGDLTSRKQLKKNLKCKDFRWYLENVYPESNMAKEFIAFGELKNVAINKCADIYYGSENSLLKLYDCHASGGNQFFAFAKSQQIITTEERCVGVNMQQKTVISVQCSKTDESQKWKYDMQSQWLVHLDSNLCVRSKLSDIVLEQCDSRSAAFKWILTPNL